MQIDIGDEEQFLRLFGVVRASMVDSDDHEMRMLYSSMKHDIDKKREFVQAVIDRKREQIKQMETQIEAERLNIIELEAERSRWEVPAHDSDTN